jgi:hypothetical protein
VHRSILEGRVIDAVERVLGGDRVEDDVAEVNSIWTDPKTYPRQIASATKMLSERVHPKTGRLIGYVACTIVSGTAHVADQEGLADLAWASPEQFSQYVRGGFAPAVQECLSTSLA